MNFDKIFSAPPTQLCMPYFYKSIKSSCQKSRIDYDRLFQSAVRNGDDYEQFIIDVNDEVNKNIAWILKVCSGGNHDAQLATYYEFKNQSSICITIENFLSWSLCGLNAAIIYFCDDISYISSNQRWFIHRIGKGDIIADINGNLIFL